MKATPQAVVLLPNKRDLNNAAVAVLSLLSLCGVTVILENNVVGVVVN